MAGGMGRGILFCRLRVWIISAAGLNFVVAVKHTNLDFAKPGIVS
jgi:hypothetical protein